MKSILDEFEYAAGTVIGTYHTRTNKNNQDSFFYFEGDHVLVGVVCDGCGSGAHSEVGASIGAPAIAWELSACGLDRVGNEPQKLKETLEWAKHLMVKRISKCAFRVGLPLVEAVSEYFLFTVVAVVVARDYTYVISFGDGFYAVNQKQVPIGPFENNAPPYIGYNIIAGKVNIMREHLGFVVNEIIPTSELSSVMIATDGIDDFLESSEKKIPGKEELVGPVSQFWDKDLFFSNPAALERRLCLINRTTSRVNRTTRALQIERGYLKDDTTILVIRRKQDDSLPEREETKPEPV